MSFFPSFETITWNTSDAILLHVLIILLTHFYNFYCILWIYLTETSSFLPYTHPVLTLKGLVPHQKFNKAILLLMIYRYSIYNNFKYIKHLHLEVKHISNHFQFIYNLVHTLNFEVQIFARKRLLKWLHWYWRIFNILIFCKQ